MGQVSGLNQRRTQQLSPSLRAEMYDVGTKEGHSYVGILFERRMPSGGVREFRTDLEHLEVIDRRTAKYAASGDLNKQHEQVGDIHVWMKRGFYPDRRCRRGAALPEGPPRHGGVAAARDLRRLAQEDGQGGPGA